MMVLDIACSKNKILGAIGLDIARDSQADIICDLEQPLPVQDATAERIYCRHIMEHLNDPKRLMRELARISRNGARIIIEVPHFSSYVAYSDFTH